MTDNTPLNADDELRVALAITPEEMCEHGVNLRLCNCHRCDGTAIYTEADRKKHELQARIHELQGIISWNVDAKTNLKVVSTITAMERVAELKQELEKS